jgi:hypothetical protein
VEYSALESEAIMAACGICDAQWDTDLPELYERMLEEGRKTAKVRTVLMTLLQPRELSLETVTIQVTDDMAKDIKDLNFSFGSDMTYASCHRGLSPLTVIGVSMAKASARRRKTERLKQATHVTVADLLAQVSTPTLSQPPTWGYYT